MAENISSTPTNGTNNSEDSPLQNYLFGDAREVYVIGYSVVVPFGMICNLLCFLTMTRKRLRVQTTFTYLSVVAITDNICFLYLVSILIYHASGVFLNYYLYCAPLLTVTITSGQCTSWLLVAVTLDR